MAPETDKLSPLEELFCESVIVVIDNTVMIRESCWHNESFTPDCEPRGKRLAVTMRPATKAEILAQKENK
jgi:hypothetical protein